MHLTSIALLNLQDSATIYFATITGRFLSE